MRVDVFDRHGRFVSSIGPKGLVQLVHSDSLDGEDVLQIGTTFPLRSGYRLVWRDANGTAHEHICQEPAGSHSEGTVVYTAKAVNSIYETYADFVEDKRPYGYTFARALAVALEGTRWSVGTVDQPGAVSSGLRFFHQSAREAVKAILDCGGELETEISCDAGRVSSRRVCIRAHRGKAGGTKRFEYGKDVTCVTRTELDDAYTACYCYGASLETEGGGYSSKLTIGSVNGGKNYVEDASALAAYGRPDGSGGKAHRFCVFEDQNCTDASLLMEEGRVYLSNRTVPSVTYEVDAVDLAQFGREWEKVACGDDCQIVDTAFDPPLRCSGRVSAIETDLLGGAQSVTIGTTSKTMADIYCEQKEQISQSYDDATDYTDVSIREQGAKFEVTADEIRAEVAGKASKSELKQTADSITSTVSEKVSTAKNQAVAEAKKYTDGVESEISTTITQTARDLTIAINSAASDASDAQDTADSAKRVTDRFTFSSSGLTIQGTSGGTYKVATYTQDGFTVDAETCTIGSAQGSLCVKDWGMYAEFSNGIQFWVTDGSRYGGGEHFYVGSPKFALLVNKDGAFVNGKTVSVS